jgi:hypothetical protein
MGQTDVWPAELAKNIGTALPIRLRHAMAWRAGKRLQRKIDNVAGAAPREGEAGAAMTVIVNDHAAIA